MWKRGQKTQLFNKIWERKKQLTKEVWEIEIDKIYNKYISNKNKLERIIVNETDKDLLKKTFKFFIEYYKEKYLKSSEKFNYDIFIDKIIELKKKI